jgi:hypothetical protein
MPCSPVMEGSVARASDSPRSRSRRACRR